jgi:hypothetical protein
MKLVKTVGLLFCCGLLLSGCASQKPEPQPAVAELEAYPGSNISTEALLSMLNVTSCHFATPTAPGYIMFNDKRYVVTDVEGVLTLKSDTQMFGVSKGEVGRRQGYWEGSPENLVFGIANDNDSFNDNLPPQILASIADMMQAARTVLVEGEVQPVD